MFSNLFLIRRCTERPIKSVVKPTWRKTYTFCFSCAELWVETFLSTLWHSYTCCVFISGLHVVFTEVLRGHVSRMNVSALKCCDAVAVLLCSRPTPWICNCYSYSLTPALKRPCKNVCLFVHELFFKAFNVEGILSFGFGVFARCVRWIFWRRFGAHSGSQNVVRKFTLHTVQNPQNQKSWVTGHESERSDLWRVKTGPIAVPETSSGNSPSLPCKSPKTKNHVTGHESDRTFLLMTSEGGSHSGSRNVVGKFTSHTVQKPQNQKSATFFVLPVLWHV